MRVLLADHHPVIREGFRLILDAVDGFEAVGCVSDGDELLRQVRHRAPDVVLVDLGGADDSLAATQRIKLRHPDVGIVLFPVQLADDQVERALACGAGGVVLKSAPILEVLEALATVARGGTIVGADVVEGSAAADLSIREREVVGLLANGMSNRDISASLLISIGTTKRHVENIARKLGTSSRAAAAAAAIRRGLVA